jgi:hypothetical protein
MNPYRKILFPVTVFQTNIRENNSLKEKYLPLMYESYATTGNKIPEGWDTASLYTSFEDDELNERVFDRKLLEVYQKYIKKFFDDVVEFDVVDLWFNCYENGEYQEQHNHLNPDIFQTEVSHFACIHYLKFDPEVHQSAIFVDPLNTLRFSSLEMKSNHYVSKYCPQIDEGDILMFPNYLEHYVKQAPPTEGNPRVTVSFNISVRKYGKLERY